MRKSDWGALAAVMAQFYPSNFRLEDPGAVEMWFRALADLPTDRVEAAIWHMVRTQPAFPTVADIRKLAEPDAPSASAAWIEACRWAREATLGPLYRAGLIIEPRRPADESICKAAEAVGGVEAIRNRTYEEDGAMRAHFFRAFTEATGCARKADTFSRVGLIQATYISGVLGAVAPRGWHEEDGGR